MAPKVIQVLIPGSYEYATLYNKSIFAGVIKVKDFSFREDNPGLSVGLI